MENYSLSDLAAITKDSDGLFGGAGGGIGLLIIIFLLLFGAGGFGGYGRQGELSTYASNAQAQDILFTQKFDAIGQKLNAIGDGLCSSTYALNNAILGEGRALQTQLSNCCCEQQRNTDALRYDMSQMIAGVNATTTAQTQKILDALCQSKIETLQGQVNQLQLQSALCGVVRYPNASTYYAGANPFCNCGNCAN